MKKCKSGYYYCNTDKSANRFLVATVSDTVVTYARRMMMMIQKVSLMAMVMGMVMVLMGTVMVAMALAEMVEEEMVVEWVKK